MMDTLLLSRIQFAFTLSFHILWPTLTIGLAAYLAFLEFRWLRTRHPHLLALYKFWAHIFALSFGMGVVSGIVLSYEFGTNFSRFSAATGNVLGPLLYYEVLAAFFMEAGFLGIMLFGWERVSPRLHFVSTLLVAVGTIISAFWIIAANSWMHTPSGMKYVNGVFHPIDWFRIVFNPSFPLRLTHMLLAAFITTGFLIAGVYAWYLLHHRERDLAVPGLRGAIGLLAVLVPAQIVIGDLHGLKTYAHQPMKVAAIEGLWETRSGAPALLFALPDETQERNHLELGIPKGASVLLEHHPDGVVRGLKEVPPDNRPPVARVFFCFRVMVGLGIAMLFIAWSGLWYRRRNDLERRRSYLRLLTGFAPGGFLATLAGWYVTEMGRQPWAVQGYLRTAEAVSDLPPEPVLVSLLGFVALYSVLLAAYLYYLVRLIKRGPGEYARPTESQIGPPTEGLRFWRMGKG
jgi:cytochrome d ubiquinol oxidase subunit I